MTRRQPIRFIAFALALSSSIAVDAHAAFIYSLRFDQSYYVAPPNGVVTVGLFLREVVTDGDINRITATNGLTQGNVRVNFEVGAMKATWTAAEPASGFSTHNTPSDQGGFTYIQQSTPTTGPGSEGVGASGTPREVGLGTVTFLVPNPTGSGSFTNISFQDPDSGVDDIVIKGFGAIDSLLIGNYGSAAIANPEPSTFVLTGMGILGAAAVCRFRRWRSKPE